MASGQAPLSWRTSSRSNGSGMCVELALTPDIAAIRDSKNPTGGTLVISPATWTGLCSAAKKGRFDLA
jgi:hypothetical protein